MTFAYSNYHFTTHSIYFCSKSNSKQLTISFVSFFGKNIRFRIKKNSTVSFFSVILTFALRTNEGYRVDTVTDAAEFPFADNFSILQRLVSHSRLVPV